MSKIIKLNQHLANLIAAGEVIERASSVVKELVENAIDARANTIAISLIDSGISEIIVSDDGEGMSPIEAKMSIEPHATSKIKSEEDLFKISTLGFRGEALPSIVSVSDFKLKTSTDGLKGYMFSVKGGQFVSEATIAHPKGTEITVRNLFFNTPARLQTLQSPSVELSYILDYVNKMALGNPHLIFKVINNGRTVLQTTGSDNALEVINNIYDVEVAKAMIPIFNSDGFFEITGLISNLSVSRSTKNHITIIVNGRAIRNNGIVNAVLNAYKNLLPIGRYPICLLNINIDYSLVDVNVHPAKLELRFTEEDRLFDLINQTITEELNNQRLIVNLDKVEKEEPYYDNWNYEEDYLDDNDHDDNDDDEYYVDLQDDDEDDDDEIILKEFDIAKAISLSNLASLRESEYHKESLLPPKEEEKIEQQQYTFTHENVISTGDDNKLPRMEYIGQLFGTYIIAQAENEFFLIDQHAAMERVMYEKILNELKKELNLSYEILLPIKLDFSLSEAVLINEKIDQIEELGIKIEFFGGGTYTLREVPIWVIKGYEKEYVEEIITHIIYNRKTQKHEFMDSLAKSLACKKSIKANQYVSSLEISYLLNDLAKCERPYTCPHGRPVIISYSKHQVEKWFKRVI